MQDHPDKLDHLKSGQVSKARDCCIIRQYNFSHSPLPPEIFLDAGSTGGQEVIQIHHRVHAGVEEGEETAVTSSDKPGKVWPC